MYLIIWLTATEYPCHISKMWYEWHSHTHVRYLSNCGIPDCLTIGFYLALITRRVLLVMQNLFNRRIQPITPSLRKDIFFLIFLCRRCCSFLFGHSMLYFSSAVIVVLLESFSFFCLNHNLFFTYYLYWKQESFNQRPGKTFPSCFYNYIPYYLAMIYGKPLSCL